MEDLIKRQGQQLSSLQEAFAKAALQQQEKQQLEQAEKIQKFVIEMTSKHFEKAQAYTNVIVIAGYAGAFTIWSSTKASLSLKANIAIAALLGFSLLSFVVHEIYGMIERARMFGRYRVLLAKITNPAEFLKSLAEAKEADERKTGHYSAVWMVALAFTIPPALAAIGLLFYNYFAVLIGWPVWPL